MGVEKYKRWEFRSVKIRAAQVEMTLRTAQLAPMFAKLRRAIWTNVRAVVGRNLRSRARRAGGALNPLRSFRVLRQTWEPRSK